MRTLYSRLSIPLMVVTCCALLMLGLSTTVLAKGFGEGNNPAGAKIKGPKIKGVFISALSNCFGGGLPCDETLTFVGKCRDLVNFACDTGTKHDKKHCRKARKRDENLLSFSFQQTASFATTQTEHAAVSPESLVDPDDPFIFPAAGFPGCYSPAGGEDLIVVEVEEEEFANDGNGVLGGEVELKRLVATP